MICVESQNIAVGLTNLYLVEFTTRLNEISGLTWHRTTRISIIDGEFRSFVGNKAGEQTGYESGIKPDVTSVVLKTETVAAITCF